MAFIIYYYIILVLQNKIYSKFNELTENKNINIITIFASPNYG